MEGVALFPTPLFMHRVDEPGLCAALTDLALAERQRSPGVKASNGGGAWHSVPDLAHRAAWAPAADVIVRAVQQSFAQVVAAHGGELSERRHGVSLQLWAMVMERGGYSAVHEHHGVGWSVALYADAGDDDTEQGGAITFVDPRRVPPLSGDVLAFPGNFTVKPRTGMLLVFPGWLSHFVHPYNGARPRVSLSANVTFSSA